jgi:hypothetical protein
MNQHIIELAQKAGFDRRERLDFDDELKQFAELIVQHCIDVCEEMAAQCGGLPGDGALARDCAHWIRRDFGVDE